MNIKSFGIDKVHSDLGFIAKHMTISKVRGNFKDYDGTIEYDLSSNEIISIEAIIKTKSIDTSNETRDTHLKAVDFFDSEIYPDIKFQMTKYVKNNDENGMVSGDLKIKDITLPINLNISINGIMQDEDGKTKIGLSLKSTIDRKSFGVGEKIPSMIVGDKIDIDIELEIFVK